MPKEKKVDEAAQLAERMLQVLESQRSFGGNAYPPTLRDLGDLCDGSPAHELIVKAAAKKAFTAKAVVVDKVDKKPSLDSPVYFKEDVPKPDEILSKRMLAVLDSQRRLGSAAYPPTLRRLAELCEVHGSATRAVKAMSHPTLAERARVVAKKGKTPNLDAPVVLQEDLDEKLSAILPALLKFAFSSITTMTKGQKVETQAFSVAEATKRLVPEMQERFFQAVERGLAQEDMPPEIAWVLIKGKPLLFLAENRRPVGGRTAPFDARAGSSPPDRGAASDNPAPAHDFDQAFRSAFERLDRRNGSTNFVKIADLRHELADFSREEFDAGLRELRIDGIFSLDSHEGLHGSLTDNDREAGVREAGSLLVYASRR